MNLRPALVAAMVSASPLGAQTAEAHIALGDRDRAARDAVGALRHYQDAILADPTSAGALWRAALGSVDLGEFDDDSRDSLYRLGEQYARRAVHADSQSSMAHFALARALGRRALSLGARDRVKYADEVRRGALESLALDSLNAGALAVMGMWHANVMRLSGISRFLAKKLLGGQVFDEASWEEAASYLERAAALEPERVVHRINLAAVYADIGDAAKARSQYELALRLPQTDFNDPNYQAQAEAGLRQLP
ncbi:MAG: hypothetical protein WD801_05705 [Gemmatimonadaceae bacterium]